VASCGGRSCGDDGCGGRCGECPAGQICSGAGSCDETDPPGPDVQCPYPTTRARASLDEGAGPDLVELEFYSGGALRRLAGSECTPAENTTSPGTATHCYQTYMCGTCAVLLGNREFAGELSWFLVPQSWGDPACGDCDGFYEVLPSDHEYLGCYMFSSLEGGCVRDGDEVVNFFGWNDGYRYAEVERPDGLSWICGRQGEWNPDSASCVADYDCCRTLEDCNCDIQLYGNRGAGGAVTWDLRTAGGACPFFLSGSPEVIQCPTTQLFTPECKECLDMCREVIGSGCCTGTGCVCDSACDG
jgi:hypothetical protein